MSVLLKACPRCRGDLHDRYGETCCLQCGWDGDTFPGAKGKGAMRLLKEPRMPTMKSTVRYDERMRAREREQHRRRQARGAS